MGLGRADHCDMCHRRLLRSELVRARVAFNRDTGANYLAYSTFDDSWWSVVSGTYDGRKANGLHPGRVRVKNDNSTEVIEASPKFTGPAQIVSGSCDLSGASSVLFSFWFGVLGEFSGPATLEYGFSNSSGGGGVTSSRQITSGRSVRPWIVATSSQIASAGLSLSSLYVTVKFSPSSGVEWWCDGCQVEADSDEPGRLIETKGERRIFSAPTTQWAWVKLCSRCIERPLKRIGAVYVPEPDVAEPIPPHLE